MICARCDQPIREGEAYDTESIDGASLAGVDVYLHRRPCQRPPEPERPRTYPLHSER